MAPGVRQAPLAWAVDPEGQKGGQGSLPPAGPRSLLHEQRPELQETEAGLGQDTL